MPAPTTPILTTFTGANEDPLSEGGAWAGPMQNGQGQLRRLTNDAFGSASGIAPYQSYRQTVYTADQDSFGFWGTLPAAAQGFACWGRITNPNSATLAQAVLGVYTEGTGFRLFDFTTGTSFAQIGSTNATVATDNQGLWLNLAGSTASLYQYISGGWALMVSAATTVSGIGRIGLELNGANIYATGFGGGSTITHRAPALVRRSRRVSWI